MNSIHEYIVDRKGEKVGCVLAVGDRDGRFAISWSLCNTNAGDIFDKNLAIKIARNRAEKHYQSIVNTIAQYVIDRGAPASMKTRYEKFEQRCLRYFKHPDS